MVYPVFRIYLIGECKVQIIWVKARKDIYRLHFSCGEGDHPNVTFDDLVVDVTIEGEYTTRFQCTEEMTIIAYKNTLKG